MTSSPQLPDTIATALARLLEQPAPEFHSGVAQLREAHPGLSEEIQRWADKLQAGLLPGAAKQAPLPAGLAPSADLQPGDRVGPFVVLDTIGHGGMGSVYLAEQKVPVRRRVALKVVKLGMDTKAVLARFEAERQALAMMDHSHIAKVLEAGVTALGKPYFAMEYVKGIPITRYCDDHKLSLEERLGLFQQVCSGVQHAHTKGVIHRDLTPNNVLVTLQDGEPAVKIIDFGLARATDHRLTEKTLFTEQGVILGTPEYMSPEQAGLDALDIDMRSDVYTLGVLLYELVAGKPPFEGKELRAQGYDRMCERIREEDPPRPSTKVTTLAGGVDAAAKLRRTDASTLLRQLRGELDWVILKCLEKNRTLRYQAVIQLAEDVGRYLDNEPVLARAPSARYRLAKFARRYRGQLAAAMGMFLLLVGGLVSSYLLWQRAEAKAAEAEAARGREADSAKEVARNAAVAQRNAEEALARKRDFELLAVDERVRELQEKLEALNGPWQDCVAAESWLNECDAVLAMRGEVQKTLSSPRSSVHLSTSAEAKAEDFRRRVLTGVLARLDEFEKAKRAAVEQRLLCAKVSINPLNARKWQQAAEAIRKADGDGASKLYKNHPIDLKPQLGLIPIGKNPKTDLWEFYHLRSAWDPAKVRDPKDIEIPEHDEDGRIAVGGDTGIVFVLLPGGTFMMGAQKTNKDGPNYDFWAETYDGPPHRVTLSPHFIARHEATEGQYRRLGGTVSNSIGDTYPSVGMSWTSCVAVLESHGLMLPSEAQWEYGCRAGTTTPWWLGKKSGSVGEELGTLRPAGTRQHNSFGLYDTIGNAMEWCRDAADWKSLAAGYGDRDGVVDPCGSSGSQRVVRGGSWISSAQDCRSADRGASVPAGAGNGLGFRPALAARSDVK